MALRTFLLGSLTALVVISCGGGGGGNFAGGIGGTGVSSGPATAFGSIIVNGVEYNTDSANFKIEGASVGVGSTGQQQLAIGMMVSVTHDSNARAKSVSFRDNAEGPMTNIVIANLTSGTGTFTVLGLSVTVDALTVFGNSSGLIGISALADGDIVEVSGQLTGTNTLLATRVEKRNAACGTAGLHIEVKGTVSNVDHTGQGSFDISSTGATVHVNANGRLPSGLADGGYVKVSSTACPQVNTLVASAIESNVSEGPDLSELDHPGDGELEIKGIVSDKTPPSGACTFSVGGQPVSASTSLCAKTTNGGRVEVHGQLSNGQFTASAISNEDSGESVAHDYKGAVTVLTHPTPFQGTIQAGNSPTLTVTLDTQFEAEGSQNYNLDTMAASSTCAEVQVNSSNSAMSIHKEDCGD